MPKIKRNLARCELCHVRLESTDPNKIMVCSCRNIWISGGLERLERGAVVEKYFLELSLFEDSPYVA